MLRSTTSIHCPLLAFVLLSSLGAQDPRPPQRDSLFGLDKIWDVKIAVDAASWLRMAPGGRAPDGPMRTRYPYVEARIEIAGHAAQDVGLRFKGNSTFWMVGRSLKRSFKIDFNRYRPDQTFLGLKKLSLNNNALDGTQIREAVSFKAYRDSGVLASRTAFARVYLTLAGRFEGEYLGLYTLIEQVDRGLLQRGLGQKGALVKPTWQVLEHFGNVWNADYDRAYLPRTDVTPAQMQPLVDLADLNREFKDGWATGASLTAAEELAIQSKFADRLDRVMDVDAFLRYTAVTTLIGNQDSPFVFPHNYYLALPDESKKVLWLPWDLNNSINGLGFLGGFNVDRQSIMEPTKRPIFARVLEVPRYRDHYRKIVKELIQGPCSAASMTANIELAHRTVKDAIAAEAKRAEIVTDPGDLVGSNVQGNRSRAATFGLGRVRDLIKFVEKREKSVLDQLAGKTDGVAARPSMLDNLMRAGGQTNRRRRDR